MTLDKFFSENKKVALAFSGGVDSSYLMYAAKAANCDIHAYYVKAAFQPMFEFEDAKKLAKELNCPMTVIELDVLADSTVIANPKDRCYHCKKVIFGNIVRCAAEDGYTVLLDGSNASDDAGDRPGMRATKELNVRSPLRESDLTKTEIRKLSKEAGLFTWDKPSYACLATRIPTGETITAEILSKVENSEDFLMSNGYSNFRVRTLEGGRIAKIQLPENQFVRLIGERDKVYTELKKYFNDIYLDLSPR